MHSVYDNSSLIEYQKTNNNNKKKDTPVAVSQVLCHTWLQTLQTCKFGTVFDM